MEMQDLKAVFDEQGRILAEHRSAIDARLAAVEAKTDAAFKRGLRPGAPAGAADGAKAFADRVAEALQAESASLFKHGRVSVDIETKASTDVVTTAEVGTVASLPGSVPYFALGTQNAVARRSITPATNLTYPRLVTVEGTAAVQTEGSTKAQLHPDFTPVTQAAMTVAAWCKVTRQAMEDYAELRAQVEASLTDAVQRAIDSALTVGAAGFAGGLEGLATVATSTTYSRLADAVSEAQAAMLEDGYAPRAVVMRPSAWLSVQLAQAGADGLYLAGGYLGGYLDPMPSGLRGLKVVLSPAATAAKALLIDPLHVELLDFGRMTVIAAVAGNDLTENKITVLVETRIVPIVRSVRALRIVTPSA